MKTLEIEGYKLVYQGGHHNVYCDGETHIRTTGGTVGHEVSTHPRWLPFKCDCSQWQRAERA